MDFEALENLCAHLSEKALPLALYTSKPVAVTRSCEANGFSQFSLACTKPGCQFRHNKIERINILRNCGHLIDKPVDERIGLVFGNLDRCLDSRARSQTA